MPRLCQPCGGLANLVNFGMADTGTTLCVVVARIPTTCNRAMNNPPNCGSIGEGGT